MLGKGDVYRVMGWGWGVVGTGSGGRGRGQNGGGDGGLRSGGHEAGTQGCCRGFWELVVGLNGGPSGGPHFLAQKVAQSLSTLSLHANL